MMLHELHWLPIKKRVMYKLLLMVYKSQHDMVPDYITAQGVGRQQQQQHNNKGTHTIHHHNIYLLVHLHEIRNKKLLFIPKTNKIAFYNITNIVYYGGNIIKRLLGTSLLLQECLFTFISLAKHALINS